MLQALFHQRRATPICVIVRTAQEFGDEDYQPQMHGHTYLGSDGDEHYFAEDDDRSIVSGELISSDDMREKTIEHWESFFDDQPDEVASMMDRGFMDDVKISIVDDWVDNEDHEEKTNFHSDDIDEDDEDRDDLIQQIKDWFEDEEGAAQKIASAVEDIEEQTKYYSEWLNETFDSHEEMLDKFREHYTDNFKDYANSDTMRGYTREAAEAVVDVDGEGHGMDVKELDDGNFISLGTWQGITADPADLPEQVGENLEALLHGGKPEQRMEPLEEEETPS